MNGISLCPVWFPKFVFNSAKSVSYGPFKWNLLLASALYGPVECQLDLFPLFCEVACEAKINATHWFITQSSDCPRTGSAPWSCLLRKLLLSKHFAQTKLSEISPTLTRTVGRQLDDRFYRFGVKFRVFTIRFQEDWMGKERSKDRLILDFRWC